MCQKLFVCHHCIPVYVGSRKCRICQELIFVDFTLMQGGCGVWGCEWPHIRDNMEMEVMIISKYNNILQVMSFAVICEEDNILTLD